VSPQCKREAVGILTAERAMGVTRACGLVGISRSLYRYASCRSPALELRDRIAELAAMKRRYGYRRIHVLLCREGWSVNHKRTYRLYREQGLMVRKRKRKRIGLTERLVVPAAQTPNQSWSMDYVADGLIDGRKLRALTVVDDFTSVQHREVLLSGNYLSSWWAGLESNQRPRDYESRSAPRGLRESLCITERGDLSMVERPRASTQNTHLRRRGESRTAGQPSCAPRPPGDPALRRRAADRGGR